MAPKATWIVIVPKVIGMSSEADLHEREDISVVYGCECSCPLVDLGALAFPDRWILRTIEFFESRSDLGRCLFLRCVAGPDKRKTLFVSEGERRIWSACRHVLVKRLFRRLK